MENKRQLMAIVVVLCLALFAVGCSVSIEEQVGQSIPQDPVNNSIERENQEIVTNGENVKQGILKVHFIDVGQADAVLVQTPEGKNMLVDAGNNNDEKELLKYLQQQGVKKLEAVVGTHPHEDHIGSLDAIIMGFPVEKVYLPNIVHTTKTFEDLLYAIKAKKLKISYVKAGGSISLGEQLTIDILAPMGTKYDDLNDYSVVLKLTYGDTAFLLTGDAENISEFEMLESGHNLNADVLKVGHHGSSSSTSLEFLKAVQPTVAVISVGEGNNYGHPHPKVISRLKKAGVDFLRTDEQGHIVIASDGENLSVETQKKQ